jgi:hypothetical protein
MEMGGAGVPRDEASSADGPLPMHAVELSFATAHTYRMHVHDTYSHVLLCKACMLPTSRVCSLPLSPLNPQALPLRHVTASTRGWNCETSWQLWIARRRRTCTKLDHLHARSLIGGD